MVWTCGIYPLSTLQSDEIRNRMSDTAPPPPAGPEAAGVDAECNAIPVGITFLKFGKIRRKTPWRQEQSLPVPATALLIVCIICFIMHTGILCMIICITILSIAWYCEIYLCWWCLSMWYCEIYLCWWCLSMWNCEIYLRWWCLSTVCDTVRYKMKKRFYILYSKQLYVQLVVYTYARLFPTFCKT